ncbi:polysaccharide biosynthesis tyrosine autokinase [Microcoleus sp. ZQ-A2]|nr:polysaccharide biosynthesis tyrosine autokinase [Microcoleus sp. FACHB-1]
MGLDGEYQPLLPNDNGKQLSHLSPLYTAELSELDQDKLDLGKVLAIARRRLIIIAGVAIAVGSGVAAKVMKQVPRYEGKFQLLVGSVSGADKVDELTQALSKNTNIPMESPDYETQIQVLWSPQVMSPIVKQIQKRYPEINYDMLRGQLGISRLAETKILEVRYQDSDPEKIQFILEQVAQGYIKYSETEQRTSLSQGLKFVNGQTEQLKKRVNELQQDIQKLRQNYKIVDPETQGQLLTNRVGDITRQRQETESQLGEAQKLYVELETQLSELGVTPEQAIVSSALSEAPRYQQLLNQLAEVKSKIAKESARLQDDNPIMQRLRDEERRLEPLVEQEALTVVGNGASGVPDNPESLASPSSIRQDLTKKLVDTKNQLQVLQVRRQEIANAERRLSQQLTDLPVVARFYTDLQRQLSVATESLSRFLAVQEKLQIEDSQKTPAWQKISEPQKPQAPISPNVPRGLVLAGIAGLLAGAGAGFLAEKLDKVFHSPDELKDSTGLPILGTIPFTKDLKKRATAPSVNVMPDAERQTIRFGGSSYGYNSSPFLESFRTLHTNLQFISPDQPIRSLVISSSTPADGKSTVTTFLAQAAAAMGLRVLLVDADLRRPRIHETTDLPNVWGLSNVISSEIHVDDVIQRCSFGADSLTPTDDNLFVLTAGQIPPDPTRLLASKKMRHLVERFQEQFDLVLFDTPPLLGLADARILAAHTDGIALVVGLGKTDRAVLTEVLYGLRTSRARVLGLIANGVKNYTTSSYDQYLRYYTQDPQRQKLSRR